MIEVIMKAIKQAIDNADLTSLSEGEVTSAPPNLKIRLKKNGKLTIPKDLLIVPEHLTSYRKVCDISSNYVSTSTESFYNFNTKGATITINNSLKVGDRVMLISFEGGQRFYILDRI